MSEYSIVVLSGFNDIFEAHFTSILQCEATSNLIVVTSGKLSDQYEEASIEDIVCIHGIDPFCFARNANLGIRAAGRRDVFLVNDDVQFLEPDSVAKLSRIAHAHPDVGILSPVFDGRVGNPMQEREYMLRTLVAASGRHPMSQVHYSEQRLCFTGVYIRREVLDLVGELDERFDGYGCEDSDYCKRVKNCGLQLAVTSDVVMRHGFADHQHTASFRRLPSYRPSGIDPEMVRKYREKWNGDKDDR